MKNGRADDDDDEPVDPKITRIEDARRRRRQGQAQERRKRFAGSMKEIVIGAVIIAMAIGFLASLAWPYLKSSGLVAR